VAIILQLLSIQLNTFWRPYIVLYNVYYHIILFTKKYQLSVQIAYT